jgi:hypothetical protein
MGLSIAGVLKGSSGAMPAATKAPHAARRDQFFCSVEFFICVSK